MTDTSQYNLTWLSLLLDSIPESPDVRKNLIEIAGYPNRESVNSNLLAFYLDSKEEHSFNRLFINSLLDLIAEKTKEEYVQREFFDTDFEVEREVRTRKGGRIDLLIREDLETSDDKEESKHESTWAILIENKIDAQLYNDLQDYWMSVKAEHKIGVVLSIDPCDDLLISLRKKDVCFINITHKELIGRIKMNLSDFYENSDDRHLLFLKEYFLNINSFYMDKEQGTLKDRNLKLFQGHKDEITKFKKNDLELLRHVSEAVFSAMKKGGFVPDNDKDSSKSKHFYFKKQFLSSQDPLLAHAEILKKFRIWIDIGELRYDNRIECYLELFNSSNTRFGDSLKKQLKEKDLFTDFVKMGTGGRSGSGYQHIYQILIPIGDYSKTGFKNQLEEALTTHLFGHQNNFILEAAIALESIISLEK